MPRAMAKGVGLQWGVDFQGVPGSLRGCGLVTGNLLGGVAGTCDVTVTAQKVLFIKLIASSVV